jgi:hypothetical protein
MENEQRWNEMARKSQLRQAEWIPIDDTLSLKQAIEEVKQLKTEIANLNQRINVHFEENKKNLQKAFAQQIVLTVPQLPPNPANKDPFETTDEYKKRLADHAAEVKAAKEKNRREIDKLKAEEDFRVVQTEARFHEQKISLLEPFVKRLQSLQERKFILPEGDMFVFLHSPDADKSRFPLELQYKDQKWTTYWNYTDRNQAKDFWNTRSYLKGQRLFQLEENNGVSIRFTGCRVSHPGTGDIRDFQLVTPDIFSEVNEWGKIKEGLPPIREKEKWAKIFYERGAIVYRLYGRYLGFRFMVSKEGTILDTKTGLEWYVNLSPGVNWNQARSWAEGLEIDGGRWRMPTMEELKGLYESGRGLDPAFPMPGKWVWSGEISSTFNFFNGKTSRLIDSSSPFPNYENCAFAVRSLR